MTTEKEIIYSTDYKPGWMIHGHTLVARAIEGELVKRTDGIPQALDVLEKQNPPSDCEHVGSNKRGNLWWMRSPEGRVILGCLDGAMYKYNFTFSE